MFHERDSFSLMRSIIHDEAKLTRQQREKKQCGQILNEEKKYREKRLQDKRIGR